MDTATLGFVISCAASLAYAASSNIIMKVFGGRNRMNEIQKEIKQLNGLAQKAMESKDEKRKKEAEKYQERIMSLTSESMKLSLKQMAVVLPLLAIFSGAINGVDNVLGVQVGLVGLKQIYPFEITLPAALPIPLYGGSLLNWRDTFGFWGWFLVLLFFSTLLMQVIVGQIEKFMKREKK